MKKTRKTSKLLYLPTTEKEFDSLVDLLVKKYKFTNKEHVEAVVSDRIQRIPPEQATTTLEYLRQCIHKSMAYLLARSRSQRIQHKAQVDDLCAALKSNPNDNEAFDALQKASDSGSEYAKEMLSQFAIQETDVQSHCESLG